MSRQKLILTELTPLECRKSMLALGKFLVFIDVVSQTADLDDLKDAVSGGIFRDDGQLHEQAFGQSSAGRSPWK